ncbi:hypothetical protein I79_003053 [Cricetulus griseus]|uniref:Uncharacterized protein n=1 Tax=Cricetulus griseus TaxID=10029 RepID=G3GZ02_CRIGR|nr:hypothetical protein I79_003053 [Cricetulus griseus]
MRISLPVEKVGLDVSSVCIEMLSVKPQTLTILALTVGNQCDSPLLTQCLILMCIT